MKLRVFVGLVLLGCGIMPGQQSRIVGPDGGTTWINDYGMGVLSVRHPGGGTSWIYDWGMGTRSVQHAGGGTSWVYGDISQSSRNAAFSLDRRYGTFFDGYQQAQDNIWRAQLLDLQRSQVRADRGSFEWEMAQQPRRVGNAQQDQLTWFIEAEISASEGRMMPARPPAPVVVEQAPVMWGMSAQAIKLAYRLAVLERVVKMTEEKIDMPGLWDFLNEQVDRMIAEAQDH